MTIEVKKPSSQITIDYFAKSLAGVKRASAENNQDACLVKHLKNHTIAVVCDGVSASELGGYGAKLAVEEFINFCSDKLTSSKSNIDVNSILSGAINYCHEQIVNKFGAGTALSTIVAVIVDTSINKVFFINAGDSPGYLVSKNKSTMVTKLHISSRPKLINKKTVVVDGMPLMKVGITCCLGLDTGVSYNLEEIAYNNGDAIILCSDGFDSTAVQTLSNNTVLASKSTLELMAKSSERTRDDTTLILLNLGKDDATLVLSQKLQNTTSISTDQKIALLESIKSNTNLVIKELKEWYEKETNQEISIKLFKLIPLAEYSKEELIKQADKAGLAGYGLLMQAIIEKVRRS